MISLDTALRAFCLTLAFLFSGCVTDSPFARKGPPAGWTTLEVAVESDGAPLAGAVIRGRWPGPYGIKWGPEIAVTDSAGRGTVPLVPGSRAVVTVAAPGKGMEVRVLTAGVVRTMIVTLSPEASITGQVTDLDGRPLSVAAIGWSDLEWNDEADSRLDETPVRVRADGSYRLGGLRPDRTYRVRALGRRATSPIRLVRPLDSPPLVFRLDPSLEEED